MHGDLATDRTLFVAGEGQVPSEIGRLVHLRRLTLRDNDLTGVSNRSCNSGVVRKHCLQNNNNKNTNERGDYLVVTLRPACLDSLCAWLACLKCTGTLPTGVANLPLDVFDVHESLLGGLCCRRHRITIDSTACSEPSVCSLCRFPSC